MGVKSWFAMYEGDYRAKTLWFTTAAQHGIYRNLLGQLNTVGPIEDDDAELRALAGASEEEWARFWPAIRQRLFIIENGMVDQKRAREERAKSPKFFGPDNHDARVKAGAKGGKASAKKRAAAKKAAKREAGTDMNAELQAAVDAWNEAAGRLGLSPVAKITRSRISALRARLKDAGGLSGWHVALEKLEKIPAMLGKGGNRPGWKATFDFLLQESRFTKLMEGGYDGWGSGGNGRQEQAYRDLEDVMAAARTRD